ncbi:LIM and cysteine-rich domains protein 1 isoform X2 [Scleropages formosus]|uniref:LIM and cysteine-rich domains protein 1 isoform X2 n=1 Tax=Scleropages formosus TaxID=113540 RepID=UPI0010FAC196|nr:LIM and cysteine-rich domains protein 1 isoform X2 [Scleropages formosus]
MHMPLTMRQCCLAFPPGLRHEWMACVFLLLLFSFLIPLYLWPRSHLRKYFVSRSVSRRRSEAVRKPYVKPKAILYMELLPEERRPMSGTDGALYRRKQLMRQLPIYDQDPAQCHGLSDPEAQAMALFVKSYKEEALGVGEVALPGERGAPRDDATKQKNGKSAPDHQGPPTNGVLGDGGKKSEYRCDRCGEPAAADSPVVYAERAGRDRLWHPTCFVCAECGEALVDLVYFWKDDALLCGRHYCQRRRPRCLGCDELIFSEGYKQGPDGQAWHKDHFCCWVCGQPIGARCSCSQRSRPL